MLRCPASGERLRHEGGGLVSESGLHKFSVTNSGIPLFAQDSCSTEGRRQQRHYDRIAEKYVANLEYPHTAEYSKSLDRALLNVAGAGPLGIVAEICCGRGEAFRLFVNRFTLGLGVDVSVSMLEAAAADLGRSPVILVQGDATNLPLAAEQFDHVVMLGGIHHVNDRERLFAEIHRILKPGGRFLWREPVSDFVLWRALRAVAYRLSPTLDHRTERPLLYGETVPPLERAGFRLTAWRTCGLIGFCLLMNSDVLVLNRAFRFIPGIQPLARLMGRLDETLLSLPLLSKAGVLVVGSAQKPGP